MRFPRLTSCLNSNGLFHVKSAVRSIALGVSRGVSAYTFLSFGISLLECNPTTASIVSLGLGGLSAAIAILDSLHNAYRSEPPRTRGQKIVFAGEAFSWAALLGIARGGSVHTGLSLLGTALEIELDRPGFVSGCGVAFITGLISLHDSYAGNVRDRQRQKEPPLLPTSARPTPRLGHFTESSRCMVFTEGAHNPTSYGAV